MPFRRNLRNNRAHTERIQLDANGATVACLRLDDKIRWCYEHIGPVGARAECSVFATSPSPGCWWASSTITTSRFRSRRHDRRGKHDQARGEPHAPIGAISQFFHRASNRGDQFRGETIEKLYDEGIQIALKYLGE